MSGRLALLLAVAAAGCQDREVVGAVLVKSVLVTAAGGGFITVTAEEDPVLAGVFLRIPPRSLPRDLTVTIERGGQDIADINTVPASPVVIVGPVGTQLAIRTTTLGLPVTEGTTIGSPFIQARDPDGRHRMLPFPTPPDARGFPTAYVDRFAAFQAVRPRPGAARPDGGTPPIPPPPLPRDAL